MHRLCVLWAAAIGARLLEGIRDQGSGIRDQGSGIGIRIRESDFGRIRVWFCTGNGADSSSIIPRLAGRFRTFHRQIRVFRNRMPHMPLKYNLLWFVVDLPHRERYFFICGCKLIVTKTG
jgi:hypothetical protein